MRSLIPLGLSFHVLATGDLLNHPCVPWKENSLHLGVGKCKPPARSKTRKCDPREVSEWSSMVWLCHRSTFLGGLLCGTLHKIEATCLSRLGRMSGQSRHTMGTRLCQGVWCEVKHNLDKRKARGFHQVTICHVPSCCLYCAHPKLSKEPIDRLCLYTEDKL